MTKPESVQARRLQFSNSLDIRLLEKLNKLSYDERISKAKLLDKAVRLLLEKHKIEIDF